MIKFYLFIKRIHFVLIFIILESLALRYYANSTAYSKVKMATASNYVVGTIHSQLSGINNYFHLKKENLQLINQVAELQNQIDQYKGMQSGVLMPDSAYLQTFNISGYEYFPVTVVNNHITNQHNYITINRGAKDGITPEMAILSAGSIAGYVIGCSDNYAVCMSVLNVDFNTSGKIKGSDYFGSIRWDGLSYEYLTLTEISKYAVINKGDSVLTTNYSSIFPPDVMIGTVEDFELQNNIYYEVKVKIQANMASLNNVLAVKYVDLEERKQLEISVNVPDEQK